MTVQSARAGPELLARLPSASLAACLAARLALRWRARLALDAPPLDACIARLQVVRVGVPVREEGAGTAAAARMPSGPSASQRSPSACARASGT